MRVTAGHIGWAEAVFVMERRHAERLQAKFGAALAGKPVIILRIPDNYSFMDASLLRLLQEKLPPYLPLL